MNESLQRLKRINRNIRDRLWNNSGRLGCPHLRFNYNLNSWMALNEDPCPNCKNKACHNSGKPFDNPKQLIILGEA